MLIINANDEALSYIRLPSAYQEVEYIQTTGTQYIDTNFVITKDTEVNIDVQLTSYSTQDRIFAIWMDSDYGGFSYEIYVNGSSKRARATQNGVGNWETSNVWVDTNRHVFILNNSRFKIYTNWNLVYNQANSANITRTQTRTLPLLARKFITSSSGYSIQQKAKAKLYSCQISDNGVLVRDFIPCYRKSDNVIGLWDSVGRVFYTNAGSGTFWKGSDV